ncbi:MAG: uroporphyrinogen decarboxylase family protein [Chitinivibrionales bacterium]|nr:uroporphyrinogen decarboxylase family protein [Chitinivibrionales bacterium]
MNGLQRYTNVLNSRPVDFLPRIPIVMQFAAEYIGSNYGAFASDFNVLVEANYRCAADFGMDQLSTISDPYRETSGFGAQIEFLKDGVPRCRDFPLAQNKDLTRLLRPDPNISARMVDRVNAIKTYKKRADTEHSIMGWIEGPIAEAADLRGVANFLTDLYEDEPFCIELMDRCVEVAIAFAAAQLKAGADTIGMGDALASQIAPDLYERLVQPREKKIVAAIKKMGGIVRLHICGNITGLLEGIAGLGIDVLDVDSMVDPRMVRDKIGHGAAIGANLDPVAVLRFGTPQIIRENLRKVYEAVGNPFMVNTGCEIPSGTPTENVMALCKPMEYIK